MPPQVDFAAINAAALAVLPAILRQWLPNGHTIGHEYTARNPTRNDRHAGSFKINVRTGRWADFATGDAGGDPISLCRTQPTGATVILNSHRQRRDYDPLSVCEIGPHLVTFRLGSIFSIT